MKVREKLMGKQGGTRNEQTRGEDREGKIISEG